MVMLDTSETKPEGGEFVNKECDAVLILESFDDRSSGQSPQLEFGFSVSSVAPGRDAEDQVGKKLTRQYFSMSKKASGRIMELACALGVPHAETGQPYTKKMWKEDVDAGRASNPDFEAGIGLACATGIRRKEWTDYDENKWQGKLRDSQAAGDEEGAAKAARVLERKEGLLQVGGDNGFSFWGLGDSGADHIPIDPSISSQFPNGLPTKEGTLRKRGQPASPAPQASRPVQQAAPARKPAPAQAPARQPVAAAAGAVDDPWA
jgi:hypothetical protein